MQYDQNVEMKVNNRQTATQNVQGCDLWLTQQSLQCRGQENKQRGEVKKCLVERLLMDMAAGFLS